MTQTVRVNLEKTFLLLKITGIVAGALISLFFAYEHVDQRLDKMEIAKAVADTEAKNRDEKMVSFGGKLDTIYEYIIANSAKVAKKD